MTKNKLLLILLTSLILSGCFTSYDKNGFDSEGIHQETQSKYNKYGYNKYGYDKYGYNKNGFNSKGYNLLGYDKNGYNKNGFNIQGFDRSGYNKNGYDKNGYDKNGYDKNGYDKNGYNINKFNKSGINKYTGTKYDKDGFDKDGLNKNGLDRARQEKEDEKAAMAKMPPAEKCKYYLNKILPSDRQNIAMSMISSGLAKEMDSDKWNTMNILESIPINDICKRYNLGIYNPEPIYNKLMSYSDIKEACSSKNVFKKAYKDTAYYKISKQVIYTSYIGEIKSFCHNFLNEYSYQNFDYD
ncbi:hypothetical protein [Francisella philomiragia]|uniref:hypothetical protein n=1 Tax=Francisella philomiragia TaxID=28110 RepID=UPI001906D53D|nr:hypothetical protein [Francisella philomiragia]MBK2267110.1 hypothetical protein [Francisella philomiragia]MBK2278390.1 hypothetical protein [Francisella philomiragia]MBK2286420.1 hypothetical protein [Francisella philomiragia]MBK2288221.1 hypothetical protein [Francisella philomiragia]MBK2291548.1 hypothetical protein [Francisella philomiragia]